MILVWSFRLRISSFPVTQTSPRMRRSKLSMRFQGEGMGGFRIQAWGQPPSAAPRFLASLPQLLEESADSFDPTVEIRNVELLVGSVQIVVWEAEAHHDRWNFEDILEVGDDWNRAAAADEHGIFLEGIVQSFGCGFDVFVVGGDHAGRAFAPDLYFRFDSLGRVFLHESQILFQDVVGILIGHEPHGYLGFRFRGDN